MNDLAKNLMAICMRNGVEIWVERDRASALQKELDRATGHMFVTYEGRTINTADMVGIFTAREVAEAHENKGQWMCPQNKWHSWRDECKCVNPELDALNRAVVFRIAECGKCKQGWINEGQIAVVCSCWADLKKKRDELN